MIRDELAEETANQQRRERVDAIIAEQQEVLQLIRKLYDFEESDDYKSAEELEERIVPFEDSLELRIKEIYLDRELNHALENGEE